MRENLNERIGWLSKDMKLGMLMIDEVCGYDMYVYVEVFVRVDGFLGIG